MYAKWEMWTKNRKLKSFSTNIIYHIRSTRLAAYVYDTHAERSTFVCEYVSKRTQSQWSSHPSYSRITVVGGKPPWPLGAESGSPQGYATTTPVATPQNQPNSTPRVLLSVTPTSSSLSETPDRSVLCRR